MKVSGFFFSQKKTLLLRYLDILADPAFQRWAMRSPLTRFVARRRAQALFDLTAGFVYSQILAACVELRVLEALRDGPRTPADLAASIDMPLAAAERLLRGATALRLTAVTRAGAYRLGESGAALLGNPGVLGLIGHHGLLYRDLADPVALLRRDDASRGALAGYWPYAVGGAAGPEQVAAYSALMAASNGMIADQVLAAYDIRRHRVLMDVGGGEGAFLSRAGAEAPDLRLILFDLPAVAARAESRLAAAGLLPRATMAGGDFFADALPEGADVITLLRVVHDHDDEAAALLLRRVRAALPAGGTLLLAEPMAATAGAERMGDAYFGFYLLAMGSGRPRTQQALCRMLLDAGFASAGAIRTAAPMLTSLIVAKA
jgi:demethylspheroidene O-methyltransferase